MNAMDLTAQAAVEGWAANDNRPIWPHQLWLDMDGVLADFDAGAQTALGTNNSYKWEWLHGSTAFWGKLNENPNFFADLPPMDDALVLFERVEHLRPIILTALPKSDAHDVDEQKRAWVAKYLGSNVRVVTCQTKDKPLYCGAGDVLVDDRSINKVRWEEAGGRYVVHANANETLAQLREWEVI